MERSATYTLQGAMLVTLPSELPAHAQMPVRHELQFDAHGRVVSTLTTSLQEPNGDDWPPILPNYKC